MKIVANKPEAAEGQGCCGKCQRGLNGNRKRMKIYSNGTTYEWEDNWAGLNGTEGASHHDIAIDSRGRVYCSFSTEPYLRVFSPDGNLLKSFNLSGPGMHCLLITKDDEGEWLWNVHLPTKTLTKSSLDGDVVQAIGRDAFQVADNEKLDVTSVAHDPETGMLWVTDGYGQWREGDFGGRMLYAFDRNLKLRMKVDCSASPCGALHEPHWIYADRRKGHTEIYVADRKNHRLVVLNGRGEFQRTVRGGLVTPSSIGGFDDKLVVAELEGRIHILNKEDEIIATMASGADYVREEGWPNRTSPHGAISPVPILKAGRLNSPHGLAVDPAGHLYISEWLKGVRMTKLHLKQLGD